MSADASRADTIRTDLRRTDLRRADLGRADLSRADARHADGRSTATRPPLADRRGSSRAIRLAMLRVVVTLAAAASAGDAWPRAANAAEANAAEANAKANAAEADDDAAIAPRLPQRHAYQRTLYQFMARVTESDTAHGVTTALDPKALDPKTIDPKTNEAARRTATGIAAEDSAAPELLYRAFLLTRMQQPLVGTKRGYPAVNAAAACFTLPLIEQADGVYYAPAWPETLVSFLQWRHPGNPYYGNRGLKMRAFMAAASNMMMFHETLDRTERSRTPVLRSDQHGYNPVFWAFPYPVFRDVLPQETRQAYETGLRMIGERLLGWRPRGDGGGRDYILPVGLLHIARALGDREFSARVEEHAKPLYTDPRFFHEAGFWDERGGIDTGFSGTANWFAVWTGLAADWPFVPAALDKVYRLRRHLLLPEPDGAATGPSHFNARLGSPVNADQWHWDGVRDSGAAMITDQAWQFALRPTDEQLRQAPAARARAFAFQLSEHGVENGKLITLEELQAGRKMPMKWVPRVWMTYNFPASVNPAYEFYRPGTWARAQSLAAARSPLLVSPFGEVAADQVRPAESFTRVFGRDFVAARRPTYAAIVHTGPVGRRQAGDERSAFPGPLGLGGGQLSAFWTPQTGSVLLGLRRGMSNDRSFDVLDEWRTWPAHAVAGRLGNGIVVSSSRCVDPRVSFSSDNSPAEKPEAAKANGVGSDEGLTVNDGGDKPLQIQVEGQLIGMATVEAAEPMSQPAKVEYVDRPLANPPRYRRSFAIEPNGIRVETAVDGLPPRSADVSSFVGGERSAQKSPGGESGAVRVVADDAFAELYEVLPVYLRHDERQAQVEPTRIEFFSGSESGQEKWQVAGDEPADGVSAIRMTRFGGSVTIRFERPQRVVLSPAVWRDNWLNAGAASRNVLVDLLAKPAAEDRQTPAAPSAPRRVVYWVEPSGRHGEG